MSPSVPADQFRRSERGRSERSGAFQHPARRSALARPARRGAPSVRVSNTQNALHRVRARGASSRGVLSNSWLPRVPDESLNATAAVGWTASATRPSVTSILSACLLPSRQASTAEMRSRTTRQKLCAGTRPTLGRCSRTRALRAAQHRANSKRTPTVAAGRPRVRWTRCQPLARYAKMALHSSKAQQLPRVVMMLSVRRRRAAFTAPRLLVSSSDRWGCFFIQPLTLTDLRPHRCVRAAAGLPSATSPPPLLRGLFPHRAHARTCTHAHPGAAGFMRNA
jgi:hypothetical protein